MNFVLDAMLGKLAKLLRILGYSAIYKKEGIGEDEVENIDGIALTRKRAWKDKKNVVVLYEDNPYNQLVELLEKGLIKWDEERVFTRCVECNGLLEDIDREEAFGLVPDYIYRSFSKFVRCKDCGKVYWEGSHTENISKNLKNLLREDG